MGRRRFTLEFKTKMVLEIIKEEKPIGDIAAEHGISPNQLRNWKREFFEKAAKVFSESKMEKELHAKGKALDEERNDLMTKVGQLTIENDWLKKNIGKSLDRTERLILVKKNDKLTVTRKCELLEINRTSVYYTPVELD